MNDSSVLEKIKDWSLYEKINHVRLGMEIAFSLTTVGQRSEAQHMINEMSEILWHVAEELEVEDDGN